MNSPLLSIVIPTYNESCDIRATLDAACAVSQGKTEVIVVDDASTDDTRSIVQEYSDRGVRLLPMRENRGVAAARNVGLSASHGEIVVFLNADAHLRSNFTEIILQHYDNGADYVVVGAAVENDHSIYPRYVQLLHQHLYYHPRLVEWTEGYSCRRSAAVAVGGFPEEFPGASGEDVVFGELMAARFRKAWEPEILVTHVAPETLPAFWNQRVGRGRGSAYLLFQHRGDPLSWLRMVRAWIALILHAVVLMPALLQGWRLVQISPRGWSDWLPMVWAHILDKCGWQVGFWLGFQELKQKR